ncbi:hypothetical protein S40285_03194 [Stachybotrys chlorohalonatus IBT 40285]|uniref:HPP transmembrane region domain-containing protein n=1 Tax=Stachybotrys chlorohalonatus (strain IBT 40285) TaxID=1283841 RepID=A0A084QI47_STAC4|nr:hypothetical protein S40285_03194 [Stachybotrys chlorohalonata IBT 40285]
MSPSWHFDIDRYLNRLVPPPPWHHVPYPVARWFGYRKKPLDDIGNLRPILWAPVGIFCSLAIIEVVSMHIPAFQDRRAPIIVGSFGAAAVLEFYAIESPLAQPRNAFFGQMVAVLVGVSICQLFQLSNDFDSIRWAGGALACALATGVMALTKTVHPPAGATALMAVVDPNVSDLGWFLFPVMMLGVALMLALALIVNNMDRRFPVYWWTPEDLGRGHTKGPMVVHQSKEHGASRDDVVDESGSEVRLDLEAGRRTHSTASSEKSVAEIVIRHGRVIVPDHVYLTQEEQQLLETMSERL